IIWLIFKIITRATCTRPSWITTLRHEALQHTVKRHAIIITVASQKDKIVYSLRCLIREKLDHELAALCHFERGKVFLILVNRHGWIRGILLRTILGQLGHIGT